MSSFRGENIFGTSFERFSGREPESADDLLLPMHCLPTQSAEQLDLINFLIPALDIQLDLINFFDRRFNFFDQILLHPDKRITISVLHNIIFELYCDIYSLSILKLLDRANIFLSFKISLKLRFYCYVTWLYFWR